MATRRDKIIGTIFEIFCIWPLVLITAIFTTLFLVAISPVVGYYIIKKRWNGKDEARKDLEDSRKGRRSY